MRQSALMRLMQPEDFFWEFGYPFEEGRKLEAQSYLYENEDGFMTSIDMPGVDSSDISIELEEGKIQISAERKFGPEKNRQVKKYFFEFQLPKNVDREKIEAHYENGVLSLVLGKVESEKSKKKIPVSTGAKSSSWSSFLGFGKNPSKVNEEVQVVN